ncbi:MAG: 50S ribosomal protein L11 methyltransferase, partial [Saprospiraceae bacterium]|nr:50S ribosomal protein L11 methyltransferase [Saprospiraceae bacterium]
VILDALPSLAAMTRAEGWLLVSGVLEQDDMVVTAAAEAAGFKKQRQTQRGNWLCIEFRKNLPA